MNFLYTKIHHIKPALVPSNKVKSPLSTTRILLKGIDLPPIPYPTPTRIL